MTSGTLSAKALEFLPQLDKSQFISTFIREQKSHANTYAADGEKYMASWDILYPPSPSVQSVEMPRDRVDFATPILKARVSNQPYKRELSHSIASSDKDQNGNSEDKIIIREPKKQPVKNRPTKRQPSLSNTNSEVDDQALRARERREKKRAKRAITRPKDDRSNDSVPHLRAKPKKGKRDKIAKGKKKDGPKGLSLMYGFAASNIANHRLTIMPGINTGVFGKGKASCKTATSQRQNKLQPGFSESEFLNPGGQKTSAKKKTSTATYSSKSSQDVAVTQEIQKQGCSVSSNDNATSSSSAQNDGSIVWDIERDDFVLASEPCASVRHLDPEVVASPSGLYAINVHRIFDHPCEEPRSDNSRVSTPASLHPSESASQIEPISTVGQPNSSKYFDQPSRPLQHRRLNTARRTVWKSSHETSPIAVESVQCNGLADNEDPAYELQPTGGLHSTPSALLDDLPVRSTEWAQPSSQNEPGDIETEHEDIDRGSQEGYCNPANFLEPFSDDPCYHNPCDEYDQVEETSRYYEASFGGMAPYVIEYDPFLDQPEENDYNYNPGSSYSPNFGLGYLISDERIPNQDGSHYSIVPLKDIRNEDLDESASLDHELSSFSTITHSTDEEVEHPEDNDPLLMAQAPGYGVLTSLRLAEISVACGLKNHWQPQKL